MPDIQIESITLPITQGEETENVKYKFPIVDPDLTTEGAAADAKKVGDELTDLKGDITDLKSAIEAGDVIVKDGHFTDAEKSLNWSAGTRKIQYDSGKNELLMSFTETSAGSKTVSCAFSQMMGFDETSVRFSTTVYPYVVLRTESNLPDAANSKFKFYIYNSNGTVGSEVSVAIPNGSKLMVINIPKLITESGQDGALKTLIEPDGIRTPSYTYTDAPDVKVLFMGMFTAEEGKNYNLAQSIEHINDDISDIETDNILTKTIGELNLFDETRTVFGIINEDGTISAGNLSKQPVASDYIAVEQERVYTAQLWENSTGDFWYRIVWFDASKNVISYRTGVTEQAIIGSYKYSVLQLTPPAGATYMRMGINTNGDGRAKIERGNITSAWTHGEGALLNHKPYNTADIHPLKSIVHRGYHVSAPENTIPAFIAAKKTDWHFVETDVSWTKDNAPVLLHDDTLNRTCCNASDGSAIVGDLTISSLDYSQLADYDACTPSQWETFKGTKIPSFEQFVALCRNIDLHPYIELKTVQSPTMDMIAGLVSTVKKYGMERNVTWISFSNILLRYVRDNCPNARLGILESSYDSRTQINASMLKTVNNEVFIDAVTTIVNETLVNECALLGIPLEVYCPDTEESMLALDGYVSGATSNLLQFDKVISDSILGT